MVSSQLGHLRLSLSRTEDSDFLTGNHFSASSLGVPPLPPPRLHSPSHQNLHISSCFTFTLLIMRRVSQAYQYLHKGHNLSRQCLCPWRPAEIRRQTNHSSLFQRIGSSGSFRDCNAHWLCLLEEETMANI